jgi:hypothetical protein
MLYLGIGGHHQMTQLEVAYHYGITPGEAEMRALDNVREVYGIRKVTFAEKDKSVKIEFDASRLKEPAVAGLLRGAGIDLLGKIAQG